jgi:lipopolysaccharide/colanic/teichoic acid biosynthesis glycosyltransferase
MRRENKSIRGSLPAAAEALVCCVGPHPTLVSVPDLRSLGDRVPWDDVVSLAGQNSVLPLLYRSLAALDEAVVAASQMGALKSFYAWNLRRSLFLLSRLMAILKQLSSNGISAIPFKGPCLAALAYGDIALRQFRDLDILVRREDVFSAHRALVDLGFHPDEEIHGGDGRMLAKRKDLPFTDSNRVVLEQHWSITSPRFSFPLKTERLWGNLIEIPVAGSARLPSLTPEELLPLLCMHAAKHYWEQLKWICDIAHLIARWPCLDWPRIVQAANRVRGARTLKLGVILAHDLFDSPLPAWLLDDIAHEKYIGGLKTRVLSRMFEKSGIETKSLDSAIFYMNSRECLRDKLVYGTHYARSKMQPTQRDRDLLRLPRALSWLHYLIRPFRISYEHGDAFEPLLRFAFVPVLDRMKRGGRAVFSQAAALLLLIAISPLLAVIALAVWLEDGRPILFSQTRIGWRGEPFQLLKVRSMRRDRQGTAITAGDDPRITRVGRWLRRLKLDELPQLWNVFRGDMNFIGPRPEVPRFVDLENPAWQEVLRIRPGITDLASLAYRDEESLLASSEDVEARYRGSVLPKKLALNLHYLRSRTTWQDIKLLALTIRYSLVPVGFEAERVLKAFNSPVRNR